MLLAVPDSTSKNTYRPEDFNPSNPYRLRVNSNSTKDLYISDVPTRDEDPMDESSTFD